jgi:hypothetical protein
MGYWPIVHVNGILAHCAVVLHCCNIVKGYWSIAHVFCMVLCTIERTLPSVQFSWLGHHYIVFDGGRPGGRPHMFSNSPRPNTPNTNKIYRLNTCVCLIYHLRMMTHIQATSMNMRFISEIMWGIGKTFLEKLEPSIFGFEFSIEYKYPLLCHGSFFLI